MDFLLPTIADSIKRSHKRLNQKKKWLITHEWKIHNYRIKFFMLVGVNIGAFAVCILLKVMHIDFYESSTFAANGLAILPYIICSLFVVNVVFIKSDLSVFR